MQECSYSGNHRFLEEVEAKNLKRPFPPYWQEWEEKERKKTNGHKIDWGGGGSDFPQKKPEQKRELEKQF